MFVIKNSFFLFSDCVALMNATAMSFDFSKLPVEMRSCEALRTELMRTHREFADEHNREKEELINKNLQLKQIVEEKVCSIRIMFHIYNLLYLNIQENNHVELQSKLDKSQELCTKQADERTTMRKELNDAKRQVSFWRATHEGLMKKDPQTLKDYNLQAVIPEVEAKKRKQREMDCTAQQNTRLQSMVEELQGEVGELQNKLDIETSYTSRVKEAFYTVRLEFEERIGEPAQTLMPKKSGGGVEPGRVNDFWA